MALFVQVHKKTCGLKPESFLEKGLEISKFWIATSYVDFQNRFIGNRKKLENLTVCNDPNMKPRSSSSLGDYRLRVALSISSKIATASNLTGKFLARNPSRKSGIKVVNMASQIVAKDLEQDSTTVLL